MTVALPKPVLTADRFARKLDTDGLELIDGRLVRKTMGAIASWIQSQLNARLVNHVNAHRLGYVFESECAYACFPGRPNHVRKPDVSFVKFGRLAGELIPDTLIPIAPDFVVEVLSTHETVGQLYGKIGDFESVGVPLIWIVSPETRTVQVRRSGSIAEFRGEAELSADPAIPGFRVRTEDLFPPKPIPA